MALRLPSVNYIFNGAVVCFRRFPLTVWSAFAAAGLCLYQIDARNNPDLVKLTFVFALGIPLFLAVTLFCERRGRNPLPLRLVGIVALAVYFLIGRKDFSADFYDHYVQLSFALHLAVAFAAFPAGTSAESFWEFNKSLYLRFMLSLLYTLSVFLGLIVAIGAVDLLFSVKLFSQVVPRVWILSAFVLHPLFFLSGVPKVAEVNDEATYPHSLRIFLQYILVPFVVLYFAILYAYMSKILVTRNWPSGRISWFIAGAEVLGVLSLLLLLPSAKKRETAWVRPYTKILNLASIPVVLMLLTAVKMRINQHGIDELRYFLVVLALWLAGISLYLFFSSAKNIKLIPQSLCVLALLTSFGPWGAYSVSLRDQLHRFEILATKTGLMKNGVLVPGAPPISSDDQKEISGILDYILETKSSKPLELWFPKNILPKDDLTRSTADLYSSGSMSAVGVRKQTSEALMRYMGQSYVNRWSQHQSFISLRREGGIYGPISGKPIRAVNIAGYDFMVPFENLGTTQIQLDGETYQFTLDVVGQSLNVSRESVAFTEVSVTPILNAAIAGGVSLIDGVLPDDTMILVAQTPKYEFKFVLEKISGLVQNKKNEITDAQGYLLVKKK